MKHYEIPHNGEFAWYGLKRVGCPDFIREQSRRETTWAKMVDAYSERECEVDCFLSVLEESTHQTFTMLDLGTGWGEWSLALAGIVQNKIIPVSFSEYFTIAVECDPKYYQITNRNFRMNSVNGAVLLGAIGDSNGNAKVNVGNISDKYCGSSLSFDGYFHDQKLFAYILGLWHLIIGKTQQVMRLTIDTILEKYQWDNVDLVVMDIQGAEYLAVAGAKNSLSKMKHLMIGTHGVHIHKTLKDFLGKHFKLLVDAPTGESNRNSK